MKTYSFYDPASGLFSPMSVTVGDSVDPSRRAPAGMIAVEGRFDFREYRVDLRTGNVEPRKGYAPPLNAVEDEVRAERDRRMAASDRVTLKSMRLGQPVPPEWAAYMQALADVPQQAGFPLNVVWPTIPG